MLVIGLVIGMGIFRTASDSAKAAETPTIFFVAWILGGVVALCGALTFGEIGSRYPITGGYYKIFSVAFHPSIAFAMNAAMLVSNAAAMSGVALIGSDYICQVIFPSGADDSIIAAIGVISILIFYGVNLLGLRLSSNTLNVLMFIKIGMIIMVIASIITVPEAESNIKSIAVEPMNSHWLLALGSALVAVCFTYGGYQQIINFGEEVEDTPKTLPRGILLGLIIVTLLYVTINYAYYHSIGFGELQNAKGVASIIAEKMFGAFGKSFFSVLLFFAVLGYVNVQLMANPRVMYAMADDGLLPQIFKNKTEGREVIYISLTVFAIISVIVLFFANTFDKILGFVMFLDSIGMALSAYTLFTIRKNTKHLSKDEIYSSKLFPIPTLLFIAVYILITISVAINYPELALIGICVFLISLGLYFLIKKIQTAKSV